LSRISDHHYCGFAYNNYLLTFTWTTIRQANLAFSVTPSQLQEVQEY
jgi:hypothetical protein